MAEIISGKSKKAQMERSSGSVGENGTTMVYVRLRRTDCKMYVSNRIKPIWTDISYDSTKMINFRDRSGVSLRPLGIYSGGKLRNRKYR